MGARSTGSHPTTTKADGHLLEYFRQTFGAGGGGTNAPPGAEGHTATGGIISDYAGDAGKFYRAHVFTSSGAFEVTALGELGNNIEFLVVAGGGGGGGSRENAAGQGGGGAGGFRTNVPGVSTPGPSPTPNVPLTSPTTFAVAQGGTYPVVVGAGGVGGFYPPKGQGGNGNDSILTHTSAPNTITSTGGGGGGSGGNPNADAAGNGGSGGGAGAYYNMVAGTGNTPSTSPIQGNAGGAGRPGSGPQSSGGGGGGAGGVGEQGTAPPGSQGAKGGLGVPVSITGIDVTYAGGGGSGAYFNPKTTTWDPTAPANGGGGGSGAMGGSGDRADTEGYAGTPGTGGGGGGATAHHPPDGPRSGGAGGAGIVVVRYQIASAATAKATGGNISYYGGKTIHTFINSGTFATTANWSAGNIEYVAVAGGGGGNLEDLGGGGGAGGFITGSTPIGAHPVSTTIQVGGGGNLSIYDYYRGGNGNPSYVGTPLTAYGGGGGAGKQSPSDADASPGGSGGGGDWGPNNGAPGDKQTGTSSAAPITPQGYPGGNGGGGSPPTAYSTGGGGGAGGAGGNGAGPYIGGAGGLGRQIPLTFRNPMSATSLGAAGPTGSVPGTNPGGDTSGKFWFAGGGGGGSDGPAGAPGGGGGGSLATPYAGGGPGGDPDSMGGNGLASTGGGGGGTDNGFNKSVPTQRGNGGSGIVLIAYPS